VNCTALIAIPVSDDCWSDALELGRHPTYIGLPYTYFDVVAVVKESPLDRVLQQSATVNRTMTEKTEGRVLSLEGVRALTASSFNTWG